MRHFRDVSKVDCFFAWICLHHGQCVGRDDMANGGHDDVLFNGRREYGDSHVVGV